MGERQDRWWDEGAHSMVQTTRGETAKPCSVVRTISLLSALESSSSYGATPSPLRASRRDDEMD